MMQKIIKYLLNILSAGLPLDYDVEILRKIFLVNLLCLTGYFFLILLGIVAFLQKNYLLGTADFITFLFLVYLPLRLRKTQKYSLIITTIVILMGIFFLFLIASGGVNNTAYVWFFTYPLMTIFLCGMRKGTFFSLLLLSLSSIVFFFGSIIDFLAFYNIDLVIRIIPAYITIYLFALIWEKIREITQKRLEIANISLQKSINDKEKLIYELQTTIAEVKTLRGILPICANCKKIRDDAGYWNRLEQYIKSHAEVEFTHCICPDCAKKLYNIDPNID